MGVVLQDYLTKKKGNMLSNIILAAGQNIFKFEMG